MGLTEEFRPKGGTTVGTAVFSQSALKNIYANASEHLKWLGEFVATADVTYEGLLHDGSTVRYDKGGRVAGSYEMEFGSESYDDADTAATEVVMRILKIYERP